MPTIRCDGCGGEFAPGQIHYFARSWREAGVRWLCGNCHPEHPADAHEPSRTPLTDAASQRQMQSSYRDHLPVGATALGNGLPSVTNTSTNTNTNTNTDAVAGQATVLRKRHRGGWPKGLKRQWKGGPAVRE